jgi:hypothetical protein
VHWSITDSSVPEGSHRYTAVLEDDALNSLSGESASYTVTETAAVVGTEVVDSEQRLEITTASAETITFTNGAGVSGELVLDDATHFTGTIMGFTGDGSVAYSDLIDLANVPLASVVAANTTYTDNGNGTGALTLNDASHHALVSLTLEGSYQLANFAFQNDGSGGVLVIDPPVQANRPAATASTSTAQDFHGAVHLADLLTPPATSAAAGTLQSLTLPGEDGKPVQINLDQAPATAPSRTGSQTADAHMGVHAIEHLNDGGMSNTLAELLHPYGHHG